MKKAFENKLGISVSEDAFVLLEKEQFSQKISDIIIRILTDILKNGVVANKEVLIREKGINLRTVGTQKEFEINKLKDLKQFYGPEQYKQMVRIIAEPMVKNINKALIPVIVEFSQNLIQPNITLNRSETEERKRAAAEKVEPILYKIKAGEMILREGERATELQLLKLKKLNADKKRRKYMRKVSEPRECFCVCF